MSEFGGTMRFFVADHESNWLGERHHGTGERLRSCIDHDHPSGIAGESNQEVISPPGRCFRPAWLGAVRIP
ncbi:MAG: hypothetical protein MUF54_03670, partial [Polyangiaceae bacterium]|nr:hypothetical protein [Polyangiaceae bacterium]